MSNVDSAFIIPIEFHFPTWIFKSSKIIFNYNNSYPKHHHFEFIFRSQYCNIFLGYQEPRKSSPLITWIQNWPWSSPKGTRNWVGGTDQTWPKAEFDWLIEIEQPVQPWATPSLQHLAKLHRWDSSLTSVFMKGAAYCNATHAFLLIVCNFLYI